MSLNLRKVFLASHCLLLVFVGILYAGVNFGYIVNQLFLFLCFLLLLLVIGATIVNMIYLLRAGQVAIVFISSLVAIFLPIIGMSLMWDKMFHSHAPPLLFFYFSLIALLGMLGIIFVAITAILRRRTSETL